MMDQSALCRPWEHTISRRQFVAAGAAATAGTLGLAPFLQTSIAEEVQKQHKQVLFIWLDGGMSQLESW
ncbi:MAG: twin-arginine translocation signal domain-containing protein, partial [Pirellulaceae bacterium]